MTNLKKICKIGITVIVDLWTSQGFTAKTVEYYKTQLEQAFVAAFGNDFSLDPALPQGVLIQELAELFYNADMDGIEVMNRINLNTASGR